MGDTGVAAAKRQASSRDRAIFPTQLPAAEWEILLTLFFLCSFLKQLGKKIPLGS